MLAVIAAVLFLISFLINAADISTNDVFTSVNIMLVGFILLSLHLAGAASWTKNRSSRRR
ncbi:hypothetical protein G3I40_32125 [Streptomyces sp. SID14478]|uniref:hypothetical protein n=1 Tax=Streptomyces sp. SID14478 TaxID=2706073 RepID=UPI0013DBE4ED|nr:hypothetical protein [Streptomyces sp. SID14478]NEB79831.1 hypothetical protein [Streptomyces sp. SID14478]